MNHKQQMTITGIHKFLKTLEATSKIQTPVGLHETSSKLETKKYTKPVYKI